MSDEVLGGLAALSPSPALPPTDGTSVGGIDVPQARDNGGLQSLLSQLAMQHLQRMKNAPTMKDHKPL